MEQALVVVGDPILSAGVAAASTGICSFGAVCLTGAFAAGFAVSELQAHLCRKRRLEELEEEVAEIQQKVWKQEERAKVSAGRTHGRFKKQRVELSRKADAATVVEQIGAKADAEVVDAAVARQVGACSAGQPAAMAVAPQGSSSSSPTEGEGGDTIAHVCDGDAVGHTPALPRLELGP